MEDQGQDLSQSLQGAGGIGGLLATMDNGETYHYFYDANGNVGQLMKASDGSIAAHYEYDPYGKILNANGPAANKNTIRFSTKFFDDETGLGYWGYRYFSPNLGRWINRDPLGEDGGVNLYAYVLNNPANMVDGDGRSSCSWLSGQIRGFCDSDKDKRAWDNFVSKSEKDIILTDEEVKDIISRSEDYRKHIEDLQSKCKDGKQWSNQIKIIERSKLKPEEPWAVAIGTLHETRIDSSCNCKCLIVEIVIVDDFDFNIIAKRSLKAEIKTIMVRTAQAVCGWKDFTHRGKTTIKQGEGCKQTGP